MISIHLFEKMALLSSWYISSDVYHDAGKARTADVSLLEGVAEPPRPRYPRNEGIVIDESAITQLCVANISDRLDILEAQRLKVQV